MSDISLVKIKYQKFVTISILLPDKRKKVQKFLHEINHIPKNPHYFFGKAIFNLPKCQIIGVNTIITVYFACLNKEINSKKEENFQNWIEIHR